MAANPATGTDYLDYYSDDPRYRGQRITNRQVQEMDNYRFSPEGQRQAWIESQPWNFQPGLWNAERNRTGIERMAAEDRALREQALANQRQQIENQFAMYDPFLGKLGDMFGGMWEGIGGMFGEGGLGNWLTDIYGPGAGGGGTVPTSGQPIGPVATTVPPPTTGTGGVGSGDLGVSPLGVSPLGVAPLGTNPLLAGTNPLNIGGIAGCG